MRERCGREGSPKGHPEAVPAVIHTVEDSHQMVAAASPTVYLNEQIGRPEKDTLNVLPVPSPPITMGGV